MIAVLNKLFSFCISRGSLLSYFSGILPFWKPTARAHTLHGLAMSSETCMPSLGPGLGSDFWQRRDTICSELAATDVTAAFLIL